MTMFDRTGSAVMRRRPGRLEGKGRVVISYRAWWDVPRVFVARWRRKLLFFDCPFSDERDDYDDHYSVYELPRRLAKRLAAMSWAGLANEGRYLGRVAVRNVKFSFEENSPATGTLRTPIPRDETRPRGGFGVNAIDREVFRKFHLDPRA